MSSDIPEGFGQSSPTIPWSIPVPLTRGGFTSLLPEHRRFDLVTDLGRISSFGIPSADRPPLLGYADYQLEPELPTPLRQGAGRAVFHAEHYLKGVGRTPLAVNWCRSGELVHATGHLPASAALRELVVSRYLRAKGLGSTIVPCEGLLVRAMPAELAERWVAGVAATGVALPPSDRCLQAISIKPGDFARWSNVHWLAQQTATLPSAMIELGVTTLHFCEPRRETALRYEDCTAERIAKALAAAFERGWANFEAFVRAGVYWGSFHNNFTLDGRFLDLEVPLVLGEGLCAKVVTVRDPNAVIDYARAGHVIGWELGYFRRQVANVLTALGLRLGELARMSSAPLVRGFAEQLRDALADTFTAQHPLRDDEWLAARLRALYCELGASEAIAERIVAAITREELGRATSLPGRASGLEFARVEPPVEVRVGIIDRAPGPRCPRAADERALLRALFDELDAIDEVDRYLDRLGGWLAILDREVRPTAKRAA